MAVQKSSESLPQREMEIAREIAHAFLHASSPLEVYRLALVRVTPLVHASFASVFLREEGDPSLLRLVSAQNWPQASARFLGHLRIRVGRGPTGRAVAEGRAVAVEDLFADPSLQDWWDPARELGFASLISLPLQGRGEVAGALSFYFEEPHLFSEEEVALLALVADQLAGTVERSRMMQELTGANERLARQNRELKQRVREAEEAKQLKNEFLANMSHELRTPLTAILGYTYLLTGEHGKGLSAEQRLAVDRVDRAATVLLRLITDLLDLSQLRLGRSQLEFSREDAERLAREAAERAGAPATGVEFQLVPCAEAIALRTDAEKASKILENLVSNAFKFTMRGRVTLTIRRALSSGAEGVEWQVRDTGIGIRSEDLGSIFDEFRQVDGSSTRLYGGTGLGLALSLRLAKLLGGEIRVESEPDRGSTFTLWLPLEPPDEPSRMDAMD